MFDIPPPPAVPQSGTYTVPLCFDSPENVGELVAALDLWRVLRLKGELSDTFLKVLDSLYDIMAGCEGCTDCEECEDCPDCPPPRTVYVDKGREKAKWGEFEVTDEGITLWECNEMAVINIYEGCGCGGSGSSTKDAAQGSNGGSGTGGNGGQTDGFVYNPPAANEIATSACDVATVVAPYVASLMSEVIQSVQQAVTAGERIIDALAEIAGENALVSAATVGTSTAASSAVDLFTDIISNTPDNMRSALESTEFQREFQFAAYQYLSRKSGALLPLTRNDLTGWVNALKLSTRVVWGAPADDDFVVGFGAYLYGLVNVVNLNRVNREATFARSDGDDDICAAAATAIGEPYSRRDGSLVTEGGGTTEESVTYGAYKFTKVMGGGVVFVGGAGAVNVFNAKGDGDGYIAQLQVIGTTCAVANCGYEIVSSNLGGFGLNSLWIKANDLVGKKMEAYAPYSSDGVAACNLFKTSDAWSPDYVGGVSAVTRFQGIVTYSAGAGSPVTYEVKAVWRIDRVS